MSMMPVLFLGHGSPLNALGENKANKEWKRLGERLQKPREVLVISAHWNRSETLIRTAQDNPKINDMYGFPKALYDLQYDPKGEPAVAEHVMTVLDNRIREDNSWGMDHGAWSVLVHLFPKADIPIIMMSIDESASPKSLYELGKALRSLREERDIDPSERKCGSQSADGRLGDGIRIWLGRWF